MTLLQLDVPFVADVADESHGHGAAAVVGGGDRAAMLGVGTSEKHWKLDAAGQVRSGGVVSLTVMICVQVPTFPHASAP